MKPDKRISPKGFRRAISIGVTLILTGAAAIIVYGVLQLAVFNTKILVATNSRTENSKAAAALMEFASAQLAAYLTSVPESVDFASEARNFKFLDASHIFVGGTTAIGRGLIDLSATLVNSDGTTKPGTFCEVCAWPDAPLPTDANAPSPVALTTGPAQLKNTTMTVANTPLNSLDSALGASYSTSAYIPLRCRIAGIPDNNGVRRNVYATGVLWMRQANLFRHTMYLNDILYYMGTGGAGSWEGSIFSNKPLVFNLQLGGANPNSQSQTGTFQFERVSSPQFFICPPGQYLNYANSGGWNSTTKTFNPPTADPASKITSSPQPAWMGRGNMDWTAGWNTFKVGNALNGDLATSWTTQNTSGNKVWNPLNVDSRPMYVTRQDIAGQLSPTDLSAFWQPGGTTTTVLDSRNPYQLQKYAPAFNGNYTTQENGFQPQLPDGVAAPTLARALIEPPSLLNADGTPVAPAKPELPKPPSRDKNPGLWDQWEAYASASSRDLLGTESAKFANKAGLYVHVNTEGEVTMFSSAADAAAFKAASDKTAWKEANASKVLKFTDSGIIDTTNLFYDDTRINRSSNGTGLNASPAALLNSSSNSQNTSNGDITSQVDQSRVVRAVDINMGALRTALRSDGKIVDGSGSAWAPSSSWRPVMYVDVESPTAATTATSTWGKTINHLTSNLAYDVTTSGGAPLYDPVTGEKIVNKGVGFNGQPLSSNLNARQHQTAVRFYNATDIPDLSQTGSDMPVAKSSVAGFTLATNAATYSVGSVNSDANETTYPTNADATKRENNAVSASGEAYHAPFGVVCDTFTYMSPGYQGNLDSVKTKSNSRTENNLTSVTNFSDARGMAFGDLATLLSIGYSGVDGSGATGPKNPYTGSRLFPTASCVELNMALVAGAHDAQTNTGIHSEPLKCFLMDNNNYTTKAIFNGSIVGLFKSQYRPRWNPDAGGGCAYGGAGGAVRYDSNFARGFVPPGTPSMRSFRLYGFKLISEEEFNRLALPSVSAVTATAK